jgi:putative ABC transport system permease protein
VIINQITTADSLLSLDVTAGSSGLVTISDQRVTAMKQLPHVVEVARVRNTNGQITIGDLTTDVTIRAVDPNFFRLHGLTVDQGRVVEDGGASEAVVSSATAKLLGLDPSKILGSAFTATVYYPTADDTGEVEIISSEKPITIVGVISDDTVSFVYAPFQALPTQPVTRYDLVKVKVASKDVAEGVRESLVAQGLVVSALSDVIQQANQIFRIVQIVLGLFGLIALAVSAIGMFNTMTITLLERTNEIGIMRSVGVTQSDVQQLFLTEAMMMGFLGGVGGVTMGYVSGWLANFAFNILATRLGGKSLTLFVEPLWFVIVIIVFSTLIGFITGVFPARRAAKMDPLEALRYK